MDLEPKEFEDVTIYTPSNVVWPNIVRIDAKKAKIWVGPYAQYKRCVHVEFIRRGKRKAEALVSSGQPYVVVVPTRRAIQPDDLYLPALGGTSATRYGVADPRWRSDFDEQLLSANVPILADYRNLPPDAETEGPFISASGATARQLPVSLMEPTTESKSEWVEFEFEEGLRHQAERSFFQRNPRLAQQAKDVYGCSCQLCGFDFAKIYGALGQDFAEVHHLNPLSERPPEEWTEAVRTSIAEVAVLCANCHRMIHRRRPAFSIDELRVMLLTNGEHKAAD